MLDERARSALAGTRFVDVRWLAETDSTNRVAADLARDGAPDGVVVGADFQTAGRGRLGRSWTAPPGSSLLVSLLLRPALGVERVGLVTTAVAVAASNACADVAGFTPALKWPNDLFVGDRKLAGILAEAGVTGDRLDWVVVGMGLNVNWPSPLPEELAGIATAANLVAGGPVDRSALLVEFLRRLDPLLSPDGFVAVPARYRERCSTLGRRVRVELAGETFEGTATDLLDDGRLVVDGRVVAAGDVVHLRPA